MIEIAEFNQKIIDQIKTSGIIARINEIKIEENPNAKIIEKMFNTPSKILLDDKGLYFFDGDDKIYCPEIFVTVSEKGEWLSDLIPNVSFDIDQSGNVRKAQEAESLFCLTIIANVLQDSSFKNELKELIDRYDFIGMRPLDNNSKTLSNLLSEWQSIQSTIINILVSACRYRISDYKKDVEKFLKDGLQDSEVLGLRDLEAVIRKINFDFSEGVLSPSNMKNLTKIDRLQKIDERDTIIKKEINNSKFGKLFQTLKLSSEYINPIKKKQIQMFVDSEINKLLNTDQYKSLKDDRINLVSQLTRRALRIERNSVRRINVEKYIQDRENYSLPPKL